MLFWNARDLERKLGDFQAYYNEVRSHASLKGHTPSTFVGGTHGGPCRTEQCLLGLPLPGLGPAPSGDPRIGRRSTAASDGEGPLNGP